MSSSIQKAIDDIYDTIEASLPNIEKGTEIEESEHSQNDETEPSHVLSSTSTTHHRDFSNNSPATPNVGDRISDFWPLDNQAYLGIGQSAERDGRLNILYDDGDTEFLNLKNEAWSFIHDVPMTSASAITTQGLHLQSIESKVLSALKSHFGNKAFMKHIAQGFEQLQALVNSFKSEEYEFIKTVTPIPLSKSPQNATVINSHVIYKIKQSEKGCLNLKSRIASHGNKDDEKDNLTKDCSNYPPTVQGILESIASLYGWKIFKQDVKSAFYRLVKPIATYT